MGQAMSDTKTREDGPDPLVSVVVPFYNSGRWIRACIESLLAARAELSTTHAGGVELIFVDNASGDDSAAIVAEYGDVTLLFEGEQGAYPARNTGIAAARAPIIAFTDADCTVDRRWLRTLVQGLEDPGVGILVGHCNYPPEASLSLRLIGSWEMAKTAYVTRHCPPANHIAYCNNMAVRASLFRDLGPFRPWRRAGDSEFAHRMAREKPECRLVYEPAMHITHHEFTSARERSRRLRLYTRTNTQIEGFEELGAGQRAALLWHWLRHDY